MTGWQPPVFMATGLRKNIFGEPEYIGREVAPMTAYEIISIFIGMLALLTSFGSFIVALLAFFDKKNKRK